MQSIVSYRYHVLIFLSQYPVINYIRDCYHQSISVNYCIGPKNPLSQCNNIACITTDGNKNKKSDIFKMQIIGIL